MNSIKPSDIDIIIPIYNALDDVKSCVRSILSSRAGYTISLILINDASDPETTAWLRNFKDTDAAIHLIEHARNQGYSQAINTGLQHSSAPYVILMNSDTIPAKTWLDDLIHCLKSHPEMGVVSPLSNSAVKQSVPSLQDTLASTINLPSQQRVDEYAEIIKKYSYAIYPVYPFIHGFCHLIKREVIDAIGVIDAESFPNGIGSEIEYCMRAAKAGYLSAVADDTFVYHSKAKSLSETSRLSEDWRAKISQKYGAEVFQQALDEANHYPALDAIRMATSHAWFQKQLHQNIQHFSFNILIILHKDSAMEILEDVLPLVRSIPAGAIKCHVAVPTQHLDRLFKKHKHLQDLEHFVIGYYDDAQISLHARYYDVVIVTEVDCLPTLMTIQDENPDILPVVWVNESHWQSETNTLRLMDHIQALDSPILMTQEWTIAKKVNATVGIHTYDIKRTFELSLIEQVLLAWNARSLVHSKKKAEWLLHLLNAKLLSHRLALPANAFDKGTPKLEGLETLHERFAIAPSLSKRRMKKLLSNPHAFFNDSENFLLRPLRFLFRA